MAEILMLRNNYNPHQSRETSHDAFILFWFLQLIATEIFICEPLRKVNSTHINLSFCGNHVDLIDNGGSGVI